MTPARKTATTKAKTPTRAAPAKAARSERHNPDTGKLTASSLLSEAEIGMLDYVRKPDGRPKSGFYRVFTDGKGDFVAVFHDHDESCQAVHPAKEAS